MCENAVATVTTAMEAIEPTVISLETELNVINTPAGIASIALYNKALQILEGWKTGTPATVAIEAIQAFTSAFNAIFAELPLPAYVQTLVDTVTAGLVVVISTLQANSPAPAGVTKEAHEATVIADSIAQVKALLPGFKESLWARGRAYFGDHTVLATEYKKEWNKNVEAAAAIDHRWASLAL